MANKLKQWLAKWYTTTGLVVRFIGTLFITFFVIKVIPYKYGSGPVSGNLMPFAMYNEECKMQNVCFTLIPPHTAGEC